MAKKEKENLKKKQAEQKEEEKKQDEITRKQRIEEAKRIASKSQEIIDHNYNALARKILKVFRVFNSRLDFILTNGFTSKIVSLVLAILLYTSINFSGDINVFGESNVGKNLYSVPVKALYDENKFQVENLPETVDLSLVGSIEAIRKTEVIGHQEVIADLTNYKAGQKQKIQLVYSGIANGVTVKFSQPTYEVNIYDTKKQVFRITSELIRVPVKEKYAYDVTLETTSIEINAAQHTLDSIASVKAMIDVEKMKKDFTQSAPLVVVDQNGNKIEGVSLSIEKIPVKVKVKKINNK